MYSRREVIDHVTVMNKELYDNLQDGIDELKQAEREVKQSVTETQESLSNTMKSLAGLGQDFSSFTDSVEKGLDDLAESFNSLEDDMNTFKEEVTEIASDGGGIKFDAERDMIVVQNPYTGKWIDYQQTGKIIQPSTITISTKSLIGEAVTCV